MYGFIGIIVFLVIVLLLSTIKILPEYERGVVLTLGRFTGTKGPGLILLIPILQRIIRVDLRVNVMDVPPQDVITQDNVSIHVNAVIYFRVVDPDKALLQVADYYTATSQLAQTRLRSVLGQHELDDILAKRDQLNAILQESLDQATDAWGIKISDVEMKDVDIDESMVRAIARQAEAERERRAKVIHAEGEMQASEKLRQAAGTLAKEPLAIQLRYLQTTLDMTNNGKTSTIVFPLPMDLLKPLTDLIDKTKSATTPDQTTPDQ